jgi:Ca2+-binding RTX toxin-like protein
MRTPARIAVLLLLALAALPGPAQAAVSCVQDEFGQPFVTLTENTDQVTLRVGPGGQVQFDGGPGFVNCGTATVNNVDTITVTDSSPGGPTGIFIDLSGGPFAPGFSSEPASPEIEFSIQGGGGLNDMVKVLGSEGVDIVVLGRGGINLRADEAAGVDADVTMQGIEILRVVAGGGNDQILASGEFGTGQDVVPFGFGGETAGTRHLSVYGEGGRDRVEGSDEMGRKVLQNARPACGQFASQLLLIYEGPALECLSGGEDVDRINGLGEREVVFGGGGDDPVQGFDGGDVVLGGAGDDTVAGNAGNDRLFGDRGEDRVFGQAGNDRLSGGPDDDRLTGGPDSDRCRGGSGADSFLTCEDLA